MKPADPMMRRCQRVIRMVGELHRQGYQRLRIFPHLYPLAWRCEIGPIEQFSRVNGAWCPADGARARYCGASGNRYFEWHDAATDSAQSLAAMFVARFPRIAAAGRGRDWEYAGWLSELLGVLERETVLPIVMAEYLEPGPEALRALPLLTMDGTWPGEFPLPPPGEFAGDLFSQPSASGAAAASRD